ncbi:TPA: pyridoxal phosphate-dependent aminotransferase [Candidatus Poribacteria bacterium]|nr:pyridoxal phosphate-dependent aminotransferase [Candidatus Poribacteria bacterium]
MAISTKARQMRSEGLDVVDFGVGEPDFDTPNYIKEAAIAAVKEGFTKYTPPSGIPELKAAIVEKFRRDNNLEYTPAQIAVSCGAKHSIYNILQAVCDPGDEVIFAAPYWVSYIEMVKLAGGKPVIIETSPAENYCMSPESIEKAVTEKTKVLILNTPSNPTGTVYDLEGLRGVAELAVKNKFYVISDEVYEKLMYDGRRHYSIAMLGDGIKNITITVNGVSKTYAMTGWRIGYAAGPEDVIDAVTRIQSHNTSNPTSISQRAALQALTGPQDDVETMRAEFEERRDYIASRFDEIETVSYVRPQGAFYIFPDVSTNYGKTFKEKRIENSMHLADYLLGEAQVAVVPGCAFGYNNCIRLSFATSVEKIGTGLNRIKQALSNLK